MSTRKQLVARLLHHIEAIGFSAHVSEGRLHARRRHLEFFSTESARRGYILVTCLSNMVGVRFTFGAEVLAAPIAPDSVVGHVLGCFLRQWLALFVFLAANDLSWDEFHDVSALATDEAWIHFNNLQCLLFLNFLFFLISKILVEFVVMQVSAASGALDLLVLRLVPYDGFLQALDVHLVEAF